MTTEIPKNEPKPTEGTSAPAKTPEPTAPKAAAPGPSIITPAQAIAEAQAEPKTVERIPTRKLLKDDEDDIPSDTDLLEMTTKSFKNRLERFTKKQLKERFGMDDPEEIKAKLTELDGYKAKEEEQRIAALSEKEKLQEERDREALKSAQWEQKHNALLEAQELGKVQSKAESIASKFIDPDYVDVAVEKLKKAVRSASEADLKNPDAFMESWFKEEIKNKPKISKDYEGKPAEVKPVMITNGANASKPANLQASGQATNKTASPNRPNSMTAEEVRELKKRNNIHW